MDEWVYRALKRWPNVPALYGWLTLDRRGRWLIKGELITRTQIVDVIDRNYACDEHGRWYFQNGPQRGYMQLERAPYIVLVESNGAALQTHNRLPVETLSAVYLDEAGGLFLQTEHGPAAWLDSDLEWALANMTVLGRTVNATQLADALALPSGHSTEIIFQWKGERLPIRRLDDALAPAYLKFLRHPEPLADARATKS